MNVTVSANTDRRWSSLAAATGVAGLVGVALLFGPVIAISSLGEPPFGGSQHLARYVWESWLWMLPYAVFWVWAFSLAVRLLRRRHLVFTPNVTERTDR